MTCGEPEKITILVIKMFAVALTLILCSSLFINDSFTATISTTSNQKTIPDVPDYWPDLGGDLTNVIWSHATNSRAKLEAALTGDIMMLEADVSFGKLIGTDEVIPIMAHPPATLSDLSLEMFIDAVIQRVSSGAAKKGVKLDFKSLDVVEVALRILQEREEQIQFPLWLNADIIDGPQDKLTRDPVNPDGFLPLCLKYFPGATISPGFTTGVPSDPEQRRYTQEQMEAMEQALKRNEYIGKRVTFPVRAILLGDSLETISWLLVATSTPDVQTTLTVWGTDYMTDEEKTKVEEVVEIIGKDRIYWDSYQRG